MVQQEDYYQDEAPRPLMSGGLIRADVLWAILRRQRAFVILAVAVALLGAIVFLHLAPRKYAVTMEIMPASSTGRVPVSGSLSALSSLAGINLGESGDSQFRVFLDFLQSPVAAEALANRQDLLKQVFPAEWSETEHRWRQPPSLIRPIGNGIRALLGFDIVPWSPPSKYRVYAYLQSQLKVLPDQKSGVVTLEIDNDKPAVAQLVLIQLNNSVDSFMRQRTLARTTSYIDYLSKKLASVTVEDYRKALLDNLAEQEKSRMMASGPVPFVSEVLGPPLVSAAPVSPSPVTTLVTAVFLGLMFGSLLAILADRRGWRFAISSRSVELSWPRVARDHTKHASQ